MKAFWPTARIRAPKRDMLSKQDEIDDLWVSCPNMFFFSDNLFYLFVILYEYIYIHYMLHINLYELTV